MEAGQSLCRWHYDIARCETRDVSGSISLVVIVAVLAALCSVPVSLTVQWLLSDILSKPTLTSNSDDEKGYARQKAVTVLPATSINAMSLSAQVTASDILREYTSLTTQIKKYRDTLQGCRLKEFDGTCTCNFTYIMLFHIYHIYHFTYIANVI